MNEVYMNKAKVGKGRSNQSFRQSLLNFFEQASFAPFLFAIQPIWHLFLINSTEVYFSETVRSILASVLFGVVVLGILYLLMRDWRKASAVASLFILLFFLFGDLSD